MANCMEMGLGFTNALRMVNESLANRGEKHIGRSAIVTAFCWMAPSVYYIPADPMDGT